MLVPSQTSTPSLYVRSRVPDAGDDMLGSHEHLVNTKKHLHTRTTDRSKP